MARAAASDPHRNNHTTPRARKPNLRPRARAGGHALVPCTRRADGQPQIFDAGRHLERRLHLRRDRVWPAALPRLVRGGPGTPFRQKKFAFFSRAAILAARLLCGSERAAHAKESRAAPTPPTPPRLLSCCASSGCWARPPRSPGPPCPSSRTTKPTTRPTTRSRSPRSARGSTRWCARAPPRSCGAHAASRTAHAPQRPHGRGRWLPARAQPLTRALPVNVHVRAGPSRASSCLG